MDYQLLEIAKAFKTEGTIKEIKPFGDGLINATFKITTEDESPNYLLQKINHNIFKDVDGLSENIDRICKHIKEKYQHLSETEKNRKTLTPIQTLENELYFTSTQKEYWRLFLFIENTSSYNKLDTKEQAYKGGKAFGQFHKLMSDLPGKPLNEVLPGFHNTKMRIENFKERVNQDPAKRLESVESEVNFLLERAEEYKKIVEQGEAGLIPQRIVHQDTKINNVLFDENDNILCVIDLDTVMPGYVCYDIGDAIRNGANTGLEDDKDLNNVSMDINLYQGFIEGFVEEAKSFLTPAEVNTLAFGAKLLTYEQAVRFLDDYLDGDNYYKINYPDHNLIRTRAQIKLLQSMEEQYDKMEEIVNRCIN